MAENISLGMTIIGELVKKNRLAVLENPIATAIGTLRAKKMIIDANIALVIFAPCVVGVRVTDGVFTRSRYFCHSP